MRRVLAIILSCFMLIGCMPSVLAEGVKASDVELTQHEFYLSVNEETRFYLKSWPSAGVEVTTSDWNVVAPFGTNGIMGTGIGEAYIIVTSKTTGQYDIAKVIVEDHYEIYDSFDFYELDNWTTYDRDGDGYSWIMASDYDEDVQTVGTDSALCASYYPSTNTKLDSSDFLISDWFSIPENVKKAQIHFKAGALNTSYTEELNVYLTEENDNVFSPYDIVEHLSINSSYMEYAIDITDYAGGSYYLAFNYNSYMKRGLWLDSAGIYYEYEKIDNITINDADITPVADEWAEDHLDYSIPSGVHYSASSHYWMDATNEQPFSNNLFQEGNSYGVGWTLLADDGYEFTYDCTVNVNDGADLYADYTGLDPMGNYFYVVTAPKEAVANEPTPITELSLTGVTLTPAAGGKAGNFCNVTLNTGNTELYQVRWYDDNAGYWMDDDDTFESGKSYCLCIEVYADPGYAFTEDIVITINGSADNVDLNATKIDNDSIAIWTRSAECPSSDLTPIETVDITGVTEYPQAGEKAGDYLDVAVSDEHVTILEAYWYCDSEYTKMNNDDVFTEGNMYSFCVSLRAADGYCFPGGVVVSMNGDVELVDFVQFPDSTQIIVWKKTVLCGEDKYIHITEVSVSDVTINPPAGETADSHYNVTLPDDLHTSVQSVNWYCYTEGRFMDDDELFELGNDYCICIKLIPDEGYMFASAVKLLINGSDDVVYPDYTVIFNSYLELWTIPTPAYDTSACELIESISISDVDTTPIAGDRADMHINYSWPTDGHYTVAEAFWFNYDTNEQLEPEDVFVAGMRYQIVFRVVPDEGYIFASYADLSINGGTVDYESGVREDGAYAMIGSVPEEAQHLDPNVTIGDANGDGKINTSDAVIILKLAAGMTQLDETQQKAADTNHDGKVNTSDAVLILKYAAGMITEF